MLETEEIEHNDGPPRPSVPGRAEEGVEEREKEGSPQPMMVEKNDSNITSPAPRLEESVEEREREGSYQATHLVLHDNAFPPTIPSTPKFIPYTTNSTAVSDTTSKKSLFEPLTKPPYVVRRRLQKDRMVVIADAFKQNVSRPLD